MEPRSGKVKLQKKNSQRGSPIQLLPRGQTLVRDVKLFKMEPGDDLEAFLMEFECAAEGALWPKEQWAVRLAPFLSGEAKAIYQSLPRSTAEDYDNLKDAILNHLRGSEETYRQKFRSLIFTAGARPRSVAHQLQDWGKRWLKPEIRSPEEIVEIIVVEQFINILPVGAVQWLNDCRMQSLDNIVRLIEGYFPREDVRPASEKVNADVLTSVWEDDNLTEDMVIVKSEIESTIDEEEEPSSEQRGPIKSSSVGTSTGLDFIKSEIASTLEDEDKPFARCVQDPEEWETIEDSSTDLVIVKSEILSTTDEEEQQFFEDSDEKEAFEFFSAAEADSKENNQARNHEESTGILGTEITLGKGKTKPPLGTQQGAACKSEKKSQRKQGSSEENRRDLAAQYQSVVSKLANSTKQRRQTGKRIHTCTECGESFSLISKLISHQRAHTDKLYICTECGKSFSKLQYLKRHQQTHPGEKPFKCAECEKSFSRLEHLITHQRMHTGEKPYTCNLCLKSFSQSSNLLTHQRSHTKEKPHICTQCGRGFRQPSGLIIHLRIHSGEKPFSCSDCGKSFISRAQHTRHQWKHTTEKLYANSPFGESLFAQPCRLTNKELHTGEKPFTCECGKSFSRLTYLKKHQKVHSGEKPFTCFECKKSFSRSEHLIMHQRVHTGEKPYSCKECGKRFSQSSSMIVHQRIHQRAKLLTLAELGKNVTTSPTLMEHQQLHILESKEPQLETFTLTENVSSD